MTEQETTIKVNANYVGDLAIALDGIPFDRRIEVRTLIVGSGLGIDEVTIHKDGHVVIYVGLNASAN